MGGNLRSGLCLTRPLDPGRPAIICVPGTLLSPEIFTQSLFPDDRQWSAMSWMMSPGPWEIDKVAERLAALLEKLDLTSVILIGHSSAGAICIKAAQLSRRVMGLVLSNTGANTRHQGDPGYPQRIVESWGPDLRRAQVRRCFAKLPSPSIMSSLDDYADRCSRDAVLAAALSLRSIDLVPTLSGIMCPVLIIHGSLDHVRTSADVETLVEHLKSSRAVYVDAGHTPMLETPTVWREQFEDWLKITGTANIKVRGV